MIYVYLSAIGIVGLALFLRWWHGICEAGEKADETYRKYVNQKAWEESMRKTTLETLYKTHKRRIP